MFNTMNHQKNDGSRHDMPNILTVLVWKVWFYVRQKILKTIWSAISFAYNLYLWKWPSETEELNSYSSNLFAEKSFLFYYLFESKFSLWSSCQIKLLSNLFLFIYVGALALGGAEPTNQVIKLFKSA